MRISKSLRARIYHKFPPAFTISLCFLALLSALGLDYISWKKGEKSYLFPALAAKKEVSFKKELLNEIILQNLLFLGIPEDSVNQFRDSKGIYHLMVDIPSEKYGLLESLLENEFKKTKSLIVKKEEQQAAGKYYFLWEIEGKGKQRVIILFSCKKEKVKIKKIPLKEKPNNKVALIIDDMGYSLKNLNNICSLDVPLTIAIIPYSPLGEETARIAHEKHLEILLHLPLEPINNGEENNNIKGLIHSNMSKDEIIDTVEKDLKQIPYIIGANNHMGSKITSNEKLMRIILECLKEKNLFFIDSRTTGSSVAFKVAQTLSIPSAYRNIFLDTVVDEDHIKAQLIKLFSLAKKNGSAVGICHPFPETLKVLRENFHLIQKYDLEPVFVSQIVQ